jgi:hypothetical protein
MREEALIENGRVSWWKIDGGEREKESKESEGRKGGYLRGKKIREPIEISTKIHARQGWRILNHFFAAVFFFFFSGILISKSKDLRDNGERRLVHLAAGWLTYPEQCLKFTRPSRHNLWDALCVAWLPKRVNPCYTNAKIAFQLAIYAREIFDTKPIDVSCSASLSAASVCEYWTLMAEKLS